MIICARLEADLVELSPEERREYLESLGVKSSGADQLIKNAYRVLGLMSFLTAGEKKRAPGPSRRAHAHRTRPVRFIPTLPAASFAPRSSATTHLLRAGSYAAAKAQGLLRLEGKDYIMQEGDVVNFRFNV